MYFWAYRTVVKQRLLRGLGVLAVASMLVTACASDDTQAATTTSTTTEPAATPDTPTTAEPAPTAETDSTATPVTPTTAPTSTTTEPTATSAADAGQQSDEPTASQSDAYIQNSDHDGQFHDAILVNRDPSCTAYATDANVGDYGSSGVTDISGGRSDAASQISIDLVIATDWNQAAFDYDTVIVTEIASEATHCRMISNMIPNHTFGVEVTGPRGDGWINAIDHTDTEITYIPIGPIKSNQASGTPRNPPIYDFDGILLNGVGIAMDSGFCYHPGVTTGPASLQTNEAGNSSGCGPRNSWFELPAYTIWDGDAELMAAVFDEYFAHGFVGTYHYHAITHPLQEDADQTQPPAGGAASPVIGFAPDGFPIYGRWFFDAAGQLVKAQSGYEVVGGDSRIPIATARHGTPPTPWDIANNPDAFESDFGLELGRYEEDWFFAGTGNLDECNGATDINGDYGYYVTDKYPFAPPCIFGPRDPSFGKSSPTL